jgi:LPS sulfotransferase NodH
MRACRRAGEELEGARGNEPVLKDYVICTTARSGSNLLCDVLRNTRVLGHPLEAFNPDFMRMGGYREYIDDAKVVQVAHFIDWIRSRHRTSNGVFGTKILFEDFQTFKSFRPFSDFFFSCNVVHLRRKSKLQQALSYFFAEETGQWVATDVPRKRLDEVKFDFEAIRRHLDRLTKQDALWTSTLGALNIPYLEIYFEDFLRDMGETIDIIASLVHVDTTNVSIKITLSEQKNALSRSYLEEFVRRFREEEFRPRADAGYKGLVFKSA